VPFIYTGALATPGNLTTNATPNTETDAFFIKAGVRNAVLRLVRLIGKGAGLTSISGIAMRMCKFATASTSGTGITPNPKDPGAQAAKATSASRPTAGTSRTNHDVFGCGAASPGGFVAPDADSCLTLEGGSAGSIDGMDISGTASLNYEFSYDLVE
jgi:hypothetical protein